MKRLNIFDEDYLSARDVTMLLEKVSGVEVDRASVTRWASGKGSLGVRLPWRRVGRSFVYRLEDVRTFLQRYQKAAEKAQRKAPGILGPNNKLLAIAQCVEKL